MAFCEVDCGADHDKLLEFIEPPADPNNLNDLQTTDPGVGAVVFRSYGKIETGSGREVWKARQVVPEVAAVIESKWSPELEDVTSRYRIRVNNKLFEILAVQNVDEDNRLMQFWCRREADY